MNTEVSGKRLSAAITVTILALAAALAAAGARDAPASNGATSAADAAALVPKAAALRADAGSDWTPARMRQAESADLGGGVQPAARGAGGSVAPTDFKAKKLSNTRSYPNRVHGRLFGTFDPGDGSQLDFSCSATVISSGSQNLIATAGHCVFDPSLEVFASDLIFVPGYTRGRAPFGVFPGTHAVTSSAWSSFMSLDHDIALVQLAAGPGGSQVGEKVGTRGIDFDPPKRQDLAVYGYPAEPDHYDGERLVRCLGRSFNEPFGHSRTPSLGTGCDMESGSSGGGWIGQSSLLVAVTSHGHAGQREVIYGPRLGKVFKRLYRFSNPTGFPSVGPYSCHGKAATIVGTDRGEKLKGTKGKDVIVALAGKDVVIGKGGNDRICLGAGNDRTRADGGNDRINGGIGNDGCDGGPGRDKASECERTKRIP